MPSNVVDRLDAKSNDAEKRGLSEIGERLQDFKTSTFISIKDKVTIQKSKIYRLSQSN